MHWSRSRYGLARSGRMLRLALIVLLVLPLGLAGLFAPAGAIEPPLAAAAGGNVTPSVTPSMTPTPSPPPPRDCLIEVFLTKIARTSLTPPGTVGNQWAFRFITHVVGSGVTIERFPALNTGLPLFAGLKRLHRDTPGPKGRTYNIEIFVIGVEDDTPGPDGVHRGFPSFRFLGDEREVVTYLFRDLPCPERGTNVVRSGPRLLAFTERLPNQRGEGPAGTVDVIEFQFEIRLDP